MNLIKKIKNLLLSFEDMFSKEHSCICCAKEIPDGTKFQMCKNCYEKLDLISGNVCAKCGEILVEDRLLCEYCKDFDYSFNSNRSICYYDDNSSNIVKSLKYAGRKYYSSHIAELMTEDKSIFEDVDIITFVPVSKKTKRARGFNQAEEIAKEISRIMNIRMVSLLEKVKDHKHQAGLNQKERLENLKGTFEINHNFESEIKGKRVLIVDDVFTTGATLSECAKVIKTKKPKQVLTLTFAKTKLVSLN